MLKKVMKHEFRAMSRIMLPIFLAEMGVIVFSVGLMVLVLTYVAKHEELLIYGVIIPVFSLLLLGAAVIGVAVFGVLRFYRSMFGDEGYLNQSLAVSPAAQIAGRLFVTVICGLAAALLAAAALSVYNLLNEAINAKVPDPFFMGAIFDLPWVDLGENRWLGAARAVLNVLRIAAFAVGVVLAIYAGIAVGNSFTKGKIGFSLLFSALFIRAASVVMGIAEALLLVIGSEVTQRTETYVPGGPLPAMFGRSQSVETACTGIELLIALALCALFYWLTYHFSTKKLNLL